MENKKLTLTLLFDFFGELLTQKQREYFDLYYNEDMSLSEIAENAGISRQGVRDMLVRAETSLLDYEAKTGVVARFLSMRGRVDEIGSLLRRAQSLSDGEAASLLGEAVSKLEALKG